MKQLIKKIKIDTTIELLTGLHIGGSKESVEIGGLDNPVIKLASKEGQPYIPGSSLKGKMLLQSQFIHRQIGKHDSFDLYFIEPAQIAAQILDFTLII